MNKNIIIIIFLIITAVGIFSLFNFKLGKILSPTRQKSNEIKIEIQDKEKSVIVKELVKESNKCENKNSVIEYDQYGGWKKIKGRKTGFFHTEKIDEKWWLITPDGYGFISKGVNTFSPRKGKEDEDLNLLKSFGLNSIGAWCSSCEDVTKDFKKNRMPYAILLDLLKNYAISKGIDVKEQKDFPDIFTNEFEQFVDQQIAAQSLELREFFVNDPFLIGWWTDNELRWPQERNHILNVYLKLPVSAPGKKIAEEFLIKMFGSPELPKDEEKLQQARDGFIEIAVGHYAKIVSNTIRKYDKNHLILGERLFFTPLTWQNTMPKRMGGFEAIGRATKGYWDVISINAYFDEIPIERTRKLYNQFQKPILISEFNVKSASKPQGKTGEAEWMEKEKISAIGYKEQISALLAEPYIVGYHWFPYRNLLLPTERNKSTGLVDYNFQPRQLLKEKFNKINLTIELIHYCED